MPLDFYCLMLKANGNNLTWSFFLSVPPQHGAVIDVWHSFLCFYFLCLSPAFPAQFSPAVCIFRRLSFLLLFHCFTRFSTSFLCKHTRTYFKALFCVFSRAPFELIRTHFAGTKPRDNLIGSYPPVTYTPPKTYHYYFQPLLPLLRPTFI